MPGCILCSLHEIGDPVGDRGGLISTAITSRRVRRNGSFFLAFDSSNRFALEGFVPPDLLFPVVCDPGRSHERAKPSSLSDVNPLQHEGIFSDSPMYRKEKTLYTKCPPSILRKRSPKTQALSEKRKGERRVRFQEKEEIIWHDISCCDYITAHKRPASTWLLVLAVLLCLVLLLAVSLYGSSMRQGFKVLEDFRAQLFIICLQIRHVASKWWRWFTRQ